jgi:hypothetical protein
MKVEEDDASKQAEQQLFELLRHVASGSGEDHRRKRILGLGDLQRRIESGHLFDQEEARSILLELARKDGDSSPENSIIVDSLSQLIERNAKHFQQILDGLKAPKEEEQRLFLVFSKLVLELDYNKKKEAVGPLVGFLMNSDSINRVGTKEVYEVLIDLGDQKLSREIIRVITPHLDAVFDTCPIVFSVQLCARFAGQEVMEKLLNILEKSLSGYYDGQGVIIEREICEYIKRVDGLQNPSQLLSLIKKRVTQNPYYASEALATVLDNKRACLDDVFDWLYGERDPNVVDCVLKSFVDMKSHMNSRELSRLLEKIRVDWWNKYPLPYTISSLFVKSGRESKSILFEAIKQSEKHQLALDCLKKIGVSREELSTIFPQAPMLELYNYFYKNRRHLPKDLNETWREKEKLPENVPGQTNQLEHLMVHILSSFNLVVMNLAPLKDISVDLIGFYPETLDVLVIGCTTGILKDDLAKMDAAVRKMKSEIVNLPKLALITPIVVVTSDASVSQSDEQYASDNNIIILQSSNIEALLDMLITNRKASEMIEYVKNQKRFVRGVQHPY